MRVLNPVITPSAMLLVPRYPKGTSDFAPSLRPRADREPIALETKNLVKPLSVSDRYSRVTAARARLETSLWRWFPADQNWVAKPHSRMLAAICATCSSEWVRAFFANGINRLTAHRSTLSAGQSTLTPLSEFRGNARGCPDR